MKKVLGYVIFFLILTFCIPIIFINYPQEISKKTQNEVTDNNISDFKYGNIKLLHVSSGEIEQLSMNQYLYGVVSAEMPASYEMEALKAQAIVARTYAIYKIEKGNKHENADICDNSNCCQAWISKDNRMARWEKDKQEEYWNKITEAVDSTDRKYITYNGDVINAFFHSNSGGKTELATEVWGGDLPYLKSVETSGEDAYSAYSSEVILSKDELVVKMNENFKDFSINFKEENYIKILEYTNSGRVKKIKIGNKEISGIEARKIFGLKSAKFDVNFENEKIVFSVIGYGHGVGLSQSGSDALSKNGYNYEQILNYYFNDIKISE